MKLSMWMIANRIMSLDPVFTIDDDAPSVLRSARLAYADNCCMLTQEDSDVVCTGTGGRIVIPDMDLKVALETFQDVFDFYNDWNETVLEAAVKMNYHTIVNECWHIFHNPIVLLDANNRVIAMSDQYGDNDVDEEWSHMSRYNYTSIDFMRYTREHYPNMDSVKEGGARFYRFEGNDSIMNFASSAVFVNGMQCARFSVIEKDRPINSGDLQMLNYMNELLGPSLALLKDRDTFNSGTTVFNSMLLGDRISCEQLKWQMDYMRWDEDDGFRVSVIESDDGRDDFVDLFCNIVKAQLPNCAVLSFEDRVVIISDNMTTTVDDLNRALREILAKNSVSIGFSLPCHDLNRTKYFYNQAKAAIKYGRIYIKNSSVFDFYNIALYYLIETGNIDDELNACHPDITFLWEYDSTYKTDRVGTLWAYIDNNLSLNATAQAIFVHRNTLVYRLKKLLSMLTYDINDVYTRDYMKMSIRILELYDKKYKRNTASSEETETAEEEPE